MTAETLTVLSAPRLGLRLHAGLMGIMLLLASLERSRLIKRCRSRIKLGTEREVRFGSLDARRDWGYSPEHVQAMWLMLQQEVPDEYVFATGESHSVRQLAQTACAAVDLNWEDYVVIDERFYRSAEVAELRGDSRKALQALGWEPQVSFSETIHRMVKTDLHRYQEDSAALKSMASDGMT